MSFGMRLLLAPIVAVVEAYKALRKAAQFLGLVETEEQEKTRGISCFKKTRQQRNV